MGKIGSVRAEIFLILTNVKRSSKNILENIVLLTIFGAERDTQPVLGVRFSAQCLMVNV